MIELTPCPDRRVVVSCDACSRPVIEAADAVLVAWASRTALVCHQGECLAALRRQYPSTTAEPVVELVDAIGQLVELLPVEVAQ